MNKSNYTNTKNRKYTVIEDHTSKRSYQHYKRLMSANKNLQTLDGIKETIMKFHGQGITNYQNPADSSRYQTESKETHATTTKFKVRPVSAKIGVSNYNQRFKKSRQYMNQSNTESIVEI